MFNNKLVISPMVEIRKRAEQQKSLLDEADTKCKLWIGCSEGLVPRVSVRTKYIDGAFLAGTVYC